jgi:hypothetical protein
MIAISGCPWVTIDRQMPSSESWRRGHGGWREAADAPPGGHELMAFHMPDRITREVTLALAAAVCTVPTVVGAQKRFVAPTDQTVFLDYQEGYGSTPVQIAYIHNLSSVQIVVYSVTLRDCENVKQSCNPQKVNIRVPASSRVVLKRIEPRRPDAAFRFSMSYGWRADSSDAEALRFLAAEGGLRAAKAQLDVREAATAEQRATVGLHDEWLTASRLAALGDQVASLRAEPDSVVLRVGQQFVVHQVRVMARTADGAFLGRVGAYEWRVPTGIVLVNADSIVARAPGRVEVEFKLVSPAPAHTAKFAVVVTADSSGLRKDHR